MKNARYNHPPPSVARLAAPQEVTELVRLFDQVAKEQGWRPGDQLQAYGDHSRYFGLRVGEEYVGGLQLVLGNRAGKLPCRSVWPELPLAGREDIADIALLALKGEWRGRGGGSLSLFWLLCIEMWRYCASAGIRELWAEVTPTNLRVYRRLGWPLTVAGPLRPHWGEDCYPCRMGVQELAESMAQKAQRSETYRSIHVLMHRERETRQRACRPAEGLVP